MPGPPRSARTLLLSCLLVATGCGSTEPEPLTAMPPAVPADLCALVPETARQGLLTNSSADESGNPTAACSLRSPDGAPTEVRAVVTWVQANDEDSADNVLDSQCRAIDRTEFREQNGFRAEGAEKACAATGSAKGRDSATLAALSGREIVTVRLTSVPSGDQASLARAQEMLEGVLSSLAGDS